MGRDGLTPFVHLHNLLQTIDLADRRHRRDDLQPAAAPVRQNGRDDTGAAQGADRRDLRRAAGSNLLDP